MIDCRAILTQFLKIEKKNYLGKKTFQHWIAHTKNWMISGNIRIGSKTNGVPIIGDK